MTMDLMRDAAVVGYGEDDILASLDPDQQQAFRTWIAGQTVPLVDGRPVIFLWDWQRFCDGRPIVD